MQHQFCKFARSRSGEPPLSTMTRTTSRAVSLGRSGIIPLSAISVSARSMLGVTEPRISGSKSKGFRIFFYMASPWMTATTSWVKKPRMSPSYLADRGAELPNPSLRGRLALVGGAVDLAQGLVEVGLIGVEQNVAASHLAQVRLGLSAEDGSPAGVTSGGHGGRFPRTRVGAGSERTLE